MTTTSVMFDQCRSRLTVTAGNRPHCGTVTAQWDTTGRELITPAPSSWAESTENGSCQVSLVWPPPQPDGYSLIIDGDARIVSVAGRELLLGICPIRALLYSRAPGQPATSANSGSDCVPILSL